MSTQRPDHSTQALSEAMPQGGMAGAASAITLATATVEDVDAILQVEQAAYPMPWSRASFLDVLARQGTGCGDYVVQLLWAAPASAQEPVEAAKAAQPAVLQGYFVALLGFEEMHLLNLAVHPDCQGQGCGWLLLQQLQNWARWHGAHTLGLEVRPSNARALALYRRFGFVEVALRKDYYPTPEGGREHAVVMQLPLQT